MQADGDVHLCAVEEHVEAGLLAYGRNSYAPRAPSHTPRGGEDIDSAEDGVDIVGGLAHAHEYDVGERGTLGNGKYLIYDCPGVEIALPTALACHAEAAVHLASGLRGNAQRGAVAVGDVDSLDVAAADTVEEVFHSAVGAPGLGDGSLAAYGVAVVDEPRACCLWQVGHGVDVGYGASVEPCSHLLGGETAQTGLGGYGLEGCEIKT